MAASGAPPFGRAAAGTGALVLRPAARPANEAAAPAAGANDGGNDPGVARHQHRLREQRRLGEIVAAITKGPRGAADPIAALGAQLVLLGLNPEALAVFRKAAKLDPANEEAKHAIAALSGGEAPLRASDGY